MAKIRLSKNELSRQRTQLKLYQKLLPSLDLKRRQLTVELAKARQALEETRAAVESLETLMRSMASERRSIASTPLRVVSPAARVIAIAWLALVVFCPAREVSSCSELETCSRLAAC